MKLSVGETLKRIIFDVVEVMVVAEAARELDPVGGFEIELQVSKRVCLVEVDVRRRAYGIAADGAKLCAIDSRSARRLQRAGQSPSHAADPSGYISPMIRPKRSGPRLAEIGQVDLDRPEW